MKPPKVTSSEYVHENPWYKIRRDVLTWPNGKPGQFFVAEFVGAVSIICIDQNRILTVEQYRHTIEQTTIELPMGGLHKGEDPLDGAKRELREETGLVAKSWTSLGVAYSLNGACKMAHHIFVAEDVSHVGNELDDSEEGMKINWIPVPDWENMIRQGKIVDAESLSPWALYKARFLS